MGDRLGALCIIVCTPDSLMHEAPESPPSAVVLSLPHVEPPSSPPRLPRYPGVWPANPTCSPATCSAIDVAASTTAAGASCAGGAASGGLTCGFACASGYAVVGSSSTITCGVNGE